jgi:flagellar motor switch protein FliM
MSLLPDALSQKDVDSLLSGQALAGQQRENIEVVPYDFRRPRRIPKDRLATIEAIYQRFAQGLQGLLASRLRLPVDTTMSSVEQATFAEFIFSLPTPCAAFVYELATAQPRQGVMDFGNDFAFLLVDRLFGGGGDSDSFNRSLTALERMVVKGIADRAIDLLGECWREHVPMTPRQIGFEAAPDSLRVADRDDSMLVANIELRCGAFSGLLVNCLPIQAIESFLTDAPARIAGRTSEGGVESRAAIETTLRGARLPIVVRFPSFTLPLRAIRALVPGQTIDTGHPVDAPLAVHVAQRPHFAGLPGRARHLFGCRISHVLEPAPESPRTVLTKGRVLT